SRCDPGQLVVVLTGRARRARYGAGGGLCRDRAVGRRMARAGRIRIRRGHAVAGGDCSRLAAATSARAGAGQRRRLQLPGPGHNPYQTPPADLASLGQSHVMSAVSPFWRHTTSPYGPLFLGLMSAVVSVTGANLTAGVLAVRVLDLAGVALLAWFVPRLARALG